MVEVAVSEQTPYKSRTVGGETFVSAMERFQTPKGREFDAHRKTSQEVLQKRAEALDQMLDIIQGSESKIDLKVPSGQSYEYTSSYIVLKTKNPELKAELARIWMNEMLAEGDYAHVVDSLLYGGVPETNIPEMQNADFIGGLFQKAQEAGDTFQAHRIAETVVQLEKNGERKKLFKTPTEESKFNEGWETRETVSFEKSIRETLDKVSKTEGFDRDVYQEVVMAYQAWFFREDGYYSENPHPLATDIAKAYCRLLVERGKKEQVYGVAVASKLPLADLTVYESGLPKIRQIKERLKRHFATISQNL